MRQYSQRSPARAQTRVRVASSITVAVEVTLRLESEDGEEVRGFHVAQVFGPLFRGELPFVRPFGEDSNAGLKLGVEFQIHDAKGRLGIQALGQRVEHPV